MVPSLFLMAARCSLISVKSAECLAVEVICGESEAEKVCIDCVNCWLGSAGDYPVAVLLLGIADNIWPPFGEVFSAF